MKRIPYILILFVISANMAAQTDTTLSQWIDSTVVSSYRNTSIIRGNMAEGMRTDAVEMGKFPKLFGQVDPVRFSQSLPGIQTNGILSYGMNINGCNDSHNSYWIADMPFSIPPRLLGFFPILNTNHFSEMKLKKDASDNHLGGELSFDMDDEIPDRVEMSASVGMISAQATVKTPVCDKLSLTASARASFINALYHNVIQIDEGSMTSDFNDLNLSVLWKPDERNTIDAHFLRSDDTYSVDYGRYSYHFDSSTPQFFSGVRWRYQGDDVAANNRFFFTRKKQSTVMSSELIQASLPSYIREAGWKGSFTLPLAINAEGEFSFYDILPQNPAIDFTYQIKSQPNLEQHALLSSITLNRVFNLADFSFRPYAILSFYREFGHENSYVHINPQLNIARELYRRGKVDLNIGVKHQYISNASMAPSSIPTSFSVATGHYIPPQRSVFADLNYSLDLADGKWGLSSQIYYKFLTNQVEYYGFVFDLVLQKNDIEDIIVNTYGHNYGFNFMISKTAGNITGWMSYSCCKTVRHSEDSRMPSAFPASHERPHELDAVVNYTAGKFEFAANCVLASGIPFTKKIPLCHI